MAKPTLAGVDIGTSKIRCVLYDTRGKLLFSCNKKTPLIKINYEYYNPIEPTFQILKYLIKKTSEFTNNNNLLLKGLSISSVGEAGVPIDKSNQALMDIIPWYDQRTESIRNKYINKKINKKIYNYTGLNSDHFYSIYKILWIKENRSKIYSKIYKWLPVNDYFAMRLTDNISTDYSQAMRTLLFNPKKLDWSNEMINIFKIKRNILPTLVNSGDKKGIIKSKLKKTFKLKYDCIVSAGGHDHFVGIYGLGGFEKNTVINSMGSAEAIAVNTKKYTFSSDLNKGKFISGVFKTKTKTNYYIVGSILTSGSIIEWFRKTFGISNFEKLSKIYNNKKPTNILFFPQFEFSHSPVNAIKTKGIILGIDRSTNISDIYMSILKYLTFDTKNALNFISKKTNIKIKKIICSGGSVKNDDWMKLRSNILNYDLFIDKNVENVSLGSAILAGLGANIYKNERDAFRKIKNKFKIIKHNKIKKEDVTLFNKYNSNFKKILEMNNIL